jgi:hypothetical protein
VGVTPRMRIQKTFNKKMLHLRGSLGTSFSQGIPIFPRENKLIFFGKFKIPWENGVPKLALKEI